MTRDDLLRQLLRLRPAALVVAGMTLCAFLILFLCVRRLEARGKGARLAGLFVGLQGRSALLLALAWVKFCLLCAILLTARSAGLAHYVLLLCLGAGFLLLRPALESLLTEVVGGGLLAAGIALCGGLLEYLRQIRNDGRIRLVYWLLAIFLILCAAGIFLREAGAISGERTYFDETGESE